MKLRSNQIKSFLLKPDPAIKAVLVYGPDSGQVREILDTITTTVAMNRQDPFQVSELAATAVRADPALLADEVAAIALTGRRRVVCIRDTDDSLVDALKSFLSTPGEGALVLVAASELSKASKLRRLFEEVDRAISFPCYLDRTPALESLIYDILQQNKLKVEVPAVVYLAEHLGSDRLQSRRELEKLALYVQSSSDTVTLADARACVGDSSDLTLDDLAVAVADGDQDRTNRIYERLMLESVSTVRVLRALIRHFQRLHLASGVIARGLNIEQAISILKLPTFFNSKKHFYTQLLVWQEASLAKALDLLIYTEISCKRGGIHNKAICSMTLLQLAKVSATLQLINREKR